VVTPGHTADSVCLLVPADGGPAHRGHGAGPGDERLIAQDGQPGRLPGAPWTGYGHSPTRARLRVLLPGPRARCSPTPAGRGLDFYIAHRRERLAEVSAAARPPGTATPAEIVARVYVDVDRGALAVRRVVGPGATGPTLADEGRPCRPG